MDLNKSNATQSSPLGLYKCVLVTVYGDTPPFACILVFWLSWDESGWEVGVFPPAYVSMQVRLGAQRPYVIQTRENYRCRRCGKEKEM